MRPHAPPELLDQAARWDQLTRWERAELGRALRRLGWTYGEIREVIPVPKGTLSQWCSQIRLTSEQVSSIKQRRPPGVRTGIPVDTQRKRRLEVERMRVEARQEARRLLADPFWSAGTSLYWAEGSKARSSLEISNSDPLLLRFFIDRVLAYHDPKAEFVLALHLHEGNIETDAQAFWRRALGLPGVGFHKTFIKPKGTGHRKNHLAHGVCRVRVRRSTDAWIRTMAWIEVLAGHRASGTAKPVANLSPGR